MNAPFKPEAAEPTLDQRLRFIDLTFECFQQAKQENEAAEGPLYPSFDGDPTSARSLAIGKRCAALRLEHMAGEGLPLSLLSECDRGLVAASMRANVLIDELRGRRND